MTLFEEFAYIKNESVPYRDVLSRFGEEKLAERYDALLSMSEEFIKAKEWQDKVIPNPMVLAYAVMDYFADVVRIKDFHENMERINRIKMISYSAYWYLRRKPLQIIAQEIDCLYANELFIFSWIIQFLNSVDKPSNIMTNKNLQPFFNTLVYYLKYRIINPQSLELMLTAFIAGRIDYVANNP